MVEVINHPVNPYLLIDGDIFLYRCGFAVEKKKYLVTGATKDEPEISGTFNSAKEAKAYAEQCEGTIWSRREVEPVENAIQATKVALREVFDKYWPKRDYWQGKIFLTGKGNFRDLLDSGRGYKDNRDPSHRPTHYRAIKEYLIKEYGASLINGEEADDAIGKEAYSRDTGTYIVVSNDKDLDQLGGFHYDWTKRLSYFVNEEEAIKFFYVQLLAGDPTDNIPGTLSKAKAETLIGECQTPGECATAAKTIFEEKYGQEWGEKLDVIAKLAWIRRGDKDEYGRAKPPFWEHLSAA